MRDEPVEAGVAVTGDTPVGERVGDRRRSARRSAGSDAAMARAGPAARLTATTGTEIAKSTWTSKMPSAKKRVSRWATPIPSAVPTTAPATPSSPAVCRKLRAILRAAAAEGLQHRDLAFLSGDKRCSWSCRSGTARDPTASTVMM